MLSMQVFIRFRRATLHVRSLHLGSIVLSTNHTADTRRYRCSKSDNIDILRGFAESLLALLYCVTVLIFFITREKQRKVSGSSITLLNLCKRHTSVVVLVTAPSHWRKVIRELYRLAWPLQTTYVSRCSITLLSLCKRHTSVTVFVTAPSHEVSLFEMNPFLCSSSFLSSLLSLSRQLRPSILFTASPPLPSPPLANETLGWNMEHHYGTTGECEYCGWRCGEPQVYQWCR